MRARASEAQSQCSLSYPANGTSHGTSFMAKWLCVCLFNSFLCVSELQKLCVHINLIKTREVLSSLWMWCGDRLKDTVMMSFDISITECATNFIPERLDWRQPSAFFSCRGRRSNPQLSHCELTAQQYRVHYAHAAEFATPMIRCV